MREVRSTRNFYYLLVLFVNAIAAVVCVGTKTPIGIANAGVLAGMLALVVMHTWSEKRCVRTRYAGYRATVTENGRMAANDGQPLPVGAELR